MSVVEHLSAHQLRAIAGAEPRHNAKGPEGSLPTLAESIRWAGWIATHPQFRARMLV